MCDSKQVPSEGAQPHDDEPTPERQAELRAAYEANVDAGRAPYAGVELRTREEVLWVLRERGWTSTEDRAANLSGAALRKVDMSGLFLYGANLSGADLFHTDLSHAMLSKANLSGADLSSANLWHANLSEAICVGARFQDAKLPDACLTFAKLGGARFYGANLSGAFLDNADLSSASLYSANLSNVDLQEANLAGAELQGADVRGAKLRRARMDAMTQLAYIELDEATLLSDVLWNGAALTQVPWEMLPIVGDEARFIVRHRADKSGRATIPAQRLADCELAVRANRQLAVALRGQGLNEHADHYAYRAEVLRRTLLWQRATMPSSALLHARTLLLPPPLGTRAFEQAKPPTRRQRGQALVGGIGAFLLDLIAGHGFRPWRAFAWYLAVISAFAIAYCLLGPSVGVPLSPLGAVVFSVTSFHGRGFFPGGSPGHSVTLDDPLTVLAAAEAVLGLFIEVSFIATFTQRYFGK